MREMKPAFALDFRDATIGLLHRTGAGWTQVGTVALDDPDLTQALGYLRSTALGLSPRGISTKLIIPNDQILYLTIAAPGPDAAKRRAQIAAALEGRTPYAVADLVFDWSGAGAEVQVAVIARETLDEAAGFAAEHRFNPVSFVAVPDEGTYKGEPWFGPTEMAADLLAAGEKVDRDKAAVIITSRAPIQDRSPAPSEPAPVAAIPQPPQQPMPPPLAPPVENSVVPAPRVEPDRAQSPSPDAVELPSFRAEVPPMRASWPEIAAEPSVPETTPMADEPPETMSFAQIMAEARAELPSLPPARPAAQPPTSQPVQNPESDEAPMALDVQGDDADDAKPASVLDPRIADDLPPEPSPSALMTFSSRRQSGDDAGFGLAAKSSASAGAAAPQAVARPAIAKPIPATGSGYDRAPPAPMIARPTVTAQTVTAPAARPAAIGKQSAAGKALRGLGSLVTAPGIAGSKTRKPPVPQIAGASQSQPLQAAKANVSAAPARVPPPKPGIGLGGKQAPVRGKPRYMGLALTLILLLCLAAVAAWSSFSLASWNSDTPAAEATVEATTDASDFPAPEDEMAADMQDPADFAPSETDIAVDAALADAALTDVDTADAALADADTPDAALPDNVAAADIPAPAPEPAPQTGLNAANVAGNSPSPEPQDEILLAAMDAPPTAPDPLSLPQPDARGDPQPASPPAPPPFGTVYKFDTDGMIVPTPEGIITPEGVLLIAGKPPVVPAARPAALAAAPVADAVVDPALATLDPALAPPLVVDPALVGKRSKPRPAALGLATSPDDDAALAPATDSRFAGLRPRLRPAEMLAAGDAARIASSSASLVATTDGGVTEGDLLVAVASRSPMAVAISRKPAPRPRDLSRAVEAAVAAAVRTPDPVPEEQIAAPEKDASPEADNEPELTTAAPSIPTKASVAKQATFKNAINLSKINLIGVYGTQSSRYALVRQANGRYKKVKVGDKIDGGQIAAITGTEVRYKKGSKMLTLAMPKS